MLTRRLAAVLLVVSALLAASCEKAGSRGSGPLQGAEAELYKDLPSAPILFGGNYLKVQDFMQSTMGKFTASLGPGMKEWTDCFVNLKNVQVAGAVTFADGKPQMRMVFRGASLEELGACATKASFKSSTDTDGKFITIEIPALAKTMQQGYLKLPSGALYLRQEFSLGAVPGVAPASRAELEGDVAALAKSGTAADDAKLMALVAKADRGKTFWFAGSAAGTPIADKVGEVWGAIDVAPGLSFDATAQITDSALAKKIMDGYDQVRKSKDQLPPEMKSMLDGLELTKSGDRLHFVMKLSESQLASLMKTMGQFGGPR